MLVYMYGGGTFILVYWLVFFAVALPAFFMEQVMGQFTSRGPVSVFRKLLPVSEGVGYAALSVLLIASVYYSSLLTYSLFYTFASMQSTMPWQSCKHDWSSPVGSLVFLTLFTSYMYIRGCSIVSQFLTTRIVWDLIGRTNGI